MSAVAHLQIVHDEDARRRALDLLQRCLKLPKVERVVQRGREAENARYTIELSDGRSVRVGTVQTLWSQVKVGQVLGVVMGCVPPALDAKDWRKLITAVINHAVDVEEAPGESFSDIALDWLRDYTKRAGTDANGCASRGNPYTEDGWLYIHAPSFGVHVKRHLHGTFGDRELRVALVDLGFERRTVNYSTGKSKKRSTVSLYRVSCDILGDTPQTDSAA